MKTAKWVAACWIVLFLAATAPAETPLQTAMSSVVSRLYAKLTPEQLLKLDEPTLESLITPEERQIFGTQFWCFDVNVPVVVSVIRPVAQEIVPFWLAERGFKKTDLRVKNDTYEYEVWQKAFDAGRVELGVPGFERHRPNYFVSVGPQTPGAALTLTNFFPSGQQVLECREGAFTYHDWPDLLLTQVPDSLKGQKLLPTMRGRARETHLVGGFRQTAYPSTPKPDQIVLTWSGDPRSSQTVQWRTSPSDADGILYYREKGSAAVMKDVTARPTTIEDPMIVNDPRVSHYTATVNDLKPGTTYVYRVGADGAESEFTTAPATDAPFSFFFMSDTHCSPVMTDVLAAGLKEYPQAAFCTISGDLVGTGQYREDWDKLFRNGAGFFATHPLMPSMGNHDCIDGLGSDLYRGLLALPENGPAKLDKELAYSFQYGNTFFLMPDVTSPIEEQTPWLEEQLSHSTAAWKFAVFHFPPYAPNDSNPDIVREWLPLFDKYHVDFVLTGHVHDYLRTYQMNGGKKMDSIAEGTVYITTVTVQGSGEKLVKPDYAAKLDASGAALCTVFSIKGNQVETRSLDKQGNEIDKAVYEKPASKM